MRLFSNNSNWSHDQFQNYFLKIPLISSVNRITMPQIIMPRSYLALLKVIINNSHEILHQSHKVTYEAYFDKIVFNVYNISRWNLQVLAPKWLTYDVIFLVLGHVHPCKEHEKEIPIFNLYVPFQTILSMKNSFFLICNYKGLMYVSVQL